MELDALKRKGELTRLEARRELLSLRSKLNPLTKNLQQQGGSFNLNIYQQAISDLFQENVPSPSFLRIQAQLCHTLHCHEIQLKQLQIIKKHNKRIIQYFQEEIKEITEDNTPREQQLMDQISSLTADLTDLKEELEKKATDQEEKITELMERLGSTANDSFMGASFSHLTDIFGSNFDPTQTPMALRKSKIWVDLQKYDQKDDSSLGRELRKPFDGSSFASSGSSSDSKMPQRRSSIMNSLFGLMEDDDDEENPQTPAAASSRPTLSRETVRSFVEHSECSDGLLSPTSDALRKLSAEVFHDF